MIWIFVRRDYGALECADVAGRSALFKARWQCNLAAGGANPRGETQHFPRCVRSPRISVGADGAASRPCVSSSVDIPVLQDSAPTRVAMDSAGSRWYAFRFARDAHPAIGELRLAECPYLPFKDKPKSSIDFWENTFNELL
jgi:hypothetical protein